jgi:predicted GH43/DUF377 family glycosyl hydrolase
MAGKKGTIVVPAKEKKKYPDGRPAATYRLDAVDSGIVIRYGAGPDSCDLFGAGNCRVLKHDSLYYLFYDGAGLKGENICQAVSADLKQWTLKGAVLKPGKPGRLDAAGVMQGTVFPVEKKWHMFYLGTPTATEENIPEYPFYLLKAESYSAGGPWKKRYNVTPLRSHHGNYFSGHAGPGQIIQFNKEYLMFFSASSNYPLKRTLGIARTTNLDSSWTAGEKPVLPPEEQVENASLYYQKENETWFLFTTHYGLKGEMEYTDAIWVYWTRDLEKWDPANKAVVLDSINCSWAKGITASPSVVQYENRLALFYDGIESPGVKDYPERFRKRSIGLAWLHLPLSPPEE